MGAGTRFYGGLAGAVGGRRSASLGSCLVTLMLSRLAVFACHACSTLFSIHRRSLLRVAVIPLPAGHAPGNVCPVQALALANPSSRRDAAKRFVGNYRSREERYILLALWGFVLWSLGFVSSANCFGGDLQLAGSKWTCPNPLGSGNPSLIEFREDHSAHVSSDRGDYYPDLRWSLAGRIAVLNQAEPLDSSSITNVLFFLSDSEARLDRIIPGMSDSEVFASVSTVGQYVNGHSNFNKDAYPCHLTSGPSIRPALAGGTSSSDPGSKKAPTAALVDPFSQSGSGAEGSSTPVERSQDSLVDPFGLPAKRPAQTTGTQSAKSETGGLADPFKEDGKNAEEKHVRYWNTCARVYVAPSSRSSTPNSYKVFAGNLCSQVLDVKFCIQRMNDGSGDLARNGSWDCGIKSNTTAAAARDGHPEDWYYGCCAVIYRTKVWAREPGFTEGWPEP
jgi:hypothetical protein